jgi:hypothetical protein
MQEMQRLTGGGGGGGGINPAGGSPFSTRSYLQSPGTVVGNSTATGVTGGISDAGLDRWNNWANNLNTHQTSDEDLFNIFGIDDPGAYEYAEGTPGGGYDWETMLEDYGLE